MNVKIGRLEDGNERYQRCFVCREFPEILIEFKKGNYTTNVPLCKEHVADLIEGLLLNTDYISE